MPQRTIALQEYTAVRLPPTALSMAEGEQIWQRYRQQIHVAFPSPQTSQQWQLTAQGWVGYLPLSPELHLWLHPRLPLPNLWGMLGYAYELAQLQIWHELVQADSLAGFYEQLAGVLAQGVLGLAQAGLYREYVGVRGNTAVVRGRIPIRPNLHQPPSATLICDYTHHTVDVLANQLLAVTLHQIARSGLCSRPIWQEVRRACQALAGVSLPPLQAEDCDRMVYDRQTEGYRLWHALCRFFLAGQGPAHAVGTQDTLPFMVDMSQLFERFVAEWLVRHLPARWLVERQPVLTAGQGVTVIPDMIIRERATYRPIAVLDTKYKVVASPEAGDVYQVAFYAAQVVGCDTAVLLYPQPLTRPWQVALPHVRLQAGWFDVTAVDLAASGTNLIQQLGLLSE
jgi:5-methylcytosine-specific restriction enzyme subunit McrC